MYEIALLQVCEKITLVHYTWRNEHFVTKYCIISTLYSKFVLVFKYYFQFITGKRCDKKTINRRKVISKG